MTEDPLATGGVAEDGRDQPGPAADEAGEAAVSLAVTRRECEEEI